MPWPDTTGESTAFRWWQRCLVSVSVGVTVFGLLLALANQTVVFDRLFDDAVDPIFWSTTDVPTDTRRFQAWAYGVLGATVAGWGVLLASVASGPFRRREPWAWSAIALSAALWYVVDTSISLSFGVFANVALNTVVLVAVGVPLAVTWRSFRERHT